MGGGLDLSTSQPWEMRVVFYHCAVNACNVAIMLKRVKEESFMILSHQYELDSNPQTSENGNRVLPLCYHCLPYCL
jgi:hypothetical protein